MYIYIRCCTFGPSQGHHTLLRVESPTHTCAWLPSPIVRISNNRYWRLKKHTSRKASFRYARVHQTLTKAYRMSLLIKLLAFIDTAVTYSRFLIRAPVPAIVLLPCLPYAYLLLLSLPPPLLGSTFAFVSFCFVS